MTFNDPFPGSARIQVEIFPSKCDHESNYLEPETEANSVQTAERQKEPSPDDAASTLSPAAPEDDLLCFGFSISFFFFLFLEYAWFVPSVACHLRRSDFISSEWKVARG